MAGSYRDAAGRAPPPPRELSPDVVRRCAYRGQLLRLFGLIWSAIGIFVALVMAVVALATGVTQMLFASAGFGGIALLAGMLWLAGWSRKRSGLRVFRDGLETRGEVVDVREDLAVRVNGRHPWKVDYTFWTSAGGATRATETFWGDRPAVSVGQSVVVLHDPDRPTRSALWSTDDGSPFTNGTVMKTAT